MESKAGYGNVVAASAGRKFTRQVGTNGLAEQALDRGVDVLVRVRKRRGRFVQLATDLVQPLLDGATFVVGEPPGPIEAARVGLVDADLFRAKTSIEIDGSAQPLQGRRGLFPEPASPELQWKYPE